ncbi:MAG: hypothetical protein R6U44_11545 [Archaeoglobaceae archaeon]
MMQKREIAKRLFAHEFNQSTHKIEEEGEKTPTYILTPTGARCNRVFVVGVLLDKEEIKPDSNFWRVRVSDPTGVFVCTAGRYQPDALEALMEIEPPEMISVVGKVNVYEGESRTFVSVRPESITVVDKEIRDYWVYETAKRTMERIEKMQNEQDDQNVSLAWQVYSTDLAEYKDTVKQALMAIKEEFDAFETDKGEKKGQEVKKEGGGEQAEEGEEEPFLEEMEFEEEEWDLSDILGE